MASVTIGDYIYTTSDTGQLTVSVEAEDKSKSGYGPIQSSVEINGVSYSVTNMGGCFNRCTSLAKAPKIPYGVTYMGGCFNGCSSLTQAPEIPSSVTEMYDCFDNCTSLTKAPKIPFGVTDMTFCFWGCSSLTQAPEIPSSVTKMSYCFDNCTSLTGTILVHNIPTRTESMFEGVPSLEVITIGATDAVYNKWSKITYDYPDVIINDFLDSSVTFSDGDYKYTSSIDSETIDNYHQNEDGDDSQAELEWDVAENGEITLCYHAPGDSTDHTVTFINNGTTQTVGPVTFDGGLVFVAEEGYTIQWLEYDAINVNVYKLSAETLDKTKEVYSALSENFYINNVVYNLVNLNHCFDSCASLAQAPEIPSSVTSMRSCFYNCSHLTGDFFVNNNPNVYDYIFTHTTEPIRIVPRYNTISQEGIAKWTVIADAYDNVTIFVPSLSFQTLSTYRVDSSGSTIISEEGSYALLEAVYAFVGLTGDVVTKVVKSNGATISPTWSETTTDGVTTARAWVHQDVDDQVNYSVTLSDDYNHTETRTFTITKVEALLDFLDGSKGMGLALGTIATQPGFYCSMDAYFKDKANIMRALFDFVYPKGSYYETCLPNLPNGVTDPANITDAHLANLGNTWFNPNYVWGGTWILETEGQVHVSAGINYIVNGAPTNTSDGGSADAIIPYHNHSVNAVTTTGMSANASHSHTIYGKYKKTVAKGSNQNRVDSDGTSSTHAPYSASSADLSHTHGVPAHNTNYAGEEGNVVGANMQPYIVVYRWFRTA